MPEFERTQVRTSVFLAASGIEAVDVGEWSVTPDLLVIDFVNGRPWAIHMSGRIAGHDDSRTGRTYHAEDGEVDHLPEFVREAVWYASLTDGGDYIDRAV